MNVNSEWVEYSIDAGPVYKIGTTTALVTGFNEPGFSFEGMESCHCFPKPRPDPHINPAHFLWTSLIFLYKIAIRFRINPAIASKLAIILFRGPTIAGAKKGDCIQIQ